MSTPYMTTKVLFIDNDVTSFEFRKCMVKALDRIPPIELFHAKDATEGLEMLEKFNPDVVVVDDELVEERDLFIESLNPIHPAIVLHTERPQVPPTRSSSFHGIDVTYLSKDESLAGLHDTLMKLTNIAGKIARMTETEQLH